MPQSIKRSSGHEHHRNGRAVTLALQGRYVHRVTYQDVEQAYAIIEFVLQKIYGGSTESIRQLIARLEARFKPVPNSA